MTSGKAGHLLCERVGGSDLEFLGSEFVIHEAFAECR